MGRDLVVEWLIPVRSLFLNVAYYDVYVLKSTIVSQMLPATCSKVTARKQTFLISRSLFPHLEQELVVSTTSSTIRMP